MNPDRFASIPFVAQGRDYDGCDCWGLVRLWYRDMLGIELDSYDGVAVTDARTIKRMIERDRVTWAKVEAPRDHDVVIMLSIENPRIETHLGVVVERRKVMHTTDPIGVQVERLSAPHIDSRILEFRRHPLLA